MALLNETFGIAGTAQDYLGGQWWLVGLLLMCVFILYFYGKGINADGIVLLLFACLILVTMSNLFVIGQNIIITVVVMILIYHAYKLYSVLTR